MKIISRTFTKLLFEAFLLRQDQCENYLNTHAEPVEAFQREYFAKALLSRLQNIQRGHPLQSLVFVVLAIILCYFTQSFGIAQEQTTTLVTKLQRTGFAPVDTIRTSTTRYGVYAHGLLQQHNANFGAFAPLIGTTNNTFFPEYGTFALAGGTIGGAAGAMAELYFAGNLGAGARVGINAFSPTFFYTLPTVIGPLAIPGQHYVNGATTFLALNIEPLVTYRLLDRLSIWASASLALPMATTFSQKIDINSIEPLIDPSLVKDVETARRILQNNAPEKQGTLQSTLMPMLNFGASWEFPLDKYGKTMLAPEVSYSIGIGEMATGLYAKKGIVPSWRMNMLRVGASLRFAPERTVGLLQEEIDEQFKRYDDSIRNDEAMKQAALRSIVKDAVQASFEDVVGQTRDGKVVPNPSIQVEEFLASTTRYLVNFVFFGEGSVELPTRYRRLRSTDRAKFSLESLADQTSIQTYYQILNIIGKRLTNTPSAKLTLIGYTDAMNEKDDKTLALRRTERIKEYLLDVWKIDEKRIVTKSGGTRQQQIADALDGEESRCVEIQSNVPEILEELRFDYTLRTIEPPILRITPKVFAGAGIKQWAFEATQFIGQESRVLKAITGNANPPIVTIDLQSAPESEQPASDDDISLELQAVDINGRDAKTPLWRIPVEMLSVEKKRKTGKRDERVDTYMVFSFILGINTLQVEDVAVQRIMNGITQTLKPGAKVDITGYTDTRGTVENNRKLSEERARSVAKLINFEGANTLGVGSTTLHDNGLPEGRFYNRFVRVDIHTPIR